MGASSNTSHAERQHQCRHHLVHRDAAIAATENMTLDRQLKTVYKIGISKNTKQHAIGCEYIRIEVDGHQLIIYYTAGVRRELRDQLIAASNEKPPWSTKAFVRIVH